MVRPDIAIQRTAAFYDRIAAWYGAIDFFLRPQKEELLKAIAHLPPGDLLDIGVGRGEIISSYRGHCVTGIDASEKMLAAARRIASPGVQLLHMQAENLAFPNHSFDTVVLSHVLAAVANPEAVLREAHRVLRPGGKAFILNHFTPHNWLRHLDAGFAPLSRLFRFRSVFFMEDLTALRLFTLSGEMPLGIGGYFKLLTLSKT